MKEKGEMKRAIGVKEQGGRKVLQSSLRHRGTGEQGKGMEGVIFRLECVTRSALRMCGGAADRARSERQGRSEEQRRS